MGVTTTQTNKPFSPRGNDQSPKGYNRAALYSGKALDFDGVNDWVNTTYSSGFTGAQEFTYCAYINADTNQETEAIIHGNENTGWGLQSLQLRYETNGIRFFAGTGSSSTSYVDSDPIEANKWYFVVGTHTPTENKIYLNGALNATATAGSLTTAPQAITIGAYPGSSVAFNGEISSPRIFDVALTAAQVADLYNNPEKVVPTGVDNTALKLWLPMMEGAGTTAYDGSGNGNHGTISGATYVNGIGAPVAQSAVMDWNKAKNDIGRSQEFDNAYWSTGNITITANDTTAPDGTTTADKLVATSTSGGANAEIYRAIGFAANDSASVFVKSDTAQWVTLGTNRTLGRVVFFDIINVVVGTESTGYTGAITEYPNGWYKLDAYWDGTATTQQYWDLSIADADNAFGVTAGKSVFAWGAYANLSGTTIGPYLPNFNSFGITSEVLLPQGLTTGRDITGVNLFENVRKQGALNLDGNSWAEVHDNESLDFGTGSFSLEAWAKAAYVNQGSGLNTIFSLGGSSSGGNTMSLNIDSGLLPIIYYNGFYSVDSSAQTAGDWFHIVGTYDETNRTIYVNGVQVDQDAQTAVSITNALVKQIGRDTNANRLYQDQIAQPRIYNRALTAEEVQRNYNAGKNTYTN